MRWCRPVLLLFLALAPSSAAAQSADAQPPAVGLAVGGWRYQLQGEDIHGYLCEAQCNPSSRVSYRLYDNTLTMTEEQFRTQQRDAAKMLEERMPPGSKVTVVGIAEERSDGIRVLRAHRLHSFANGRVEHVISAFVFGAPRPFSLISSADEERAAKDNFEMFLPRVLLVVKITPRQ